MCINKLGIELDAEYMYNELVFFYKQYQNLSIQMN